MLQLFPVLDRTTTLLRVRVQEISANFKIITVNKNDRIVADVIYGVGEITKCILKHPHHVIVGIFDTDIFNQRT
jgi:hypothetical protein